MFLVSAVLSVGLSAIFAESINGGNLRFVPQQERTTTMMQPPMMQPPMMPPPMMPPPMMPPPMMPPPMMQPPMMPPPMMPPPMMQPPMMQPPMMQGFQCPFSMNPQQLSLLLMSTYARMMALTQLMSMQNRYQPYQPNQNSDPAANNYGPTPDPLPYAQQPQVDIQNRQAEENELEKQQQEIERQLRDEEEIRKEREEAEKQILEEQQKEMEQKENDLKLRQEEELRFQKIEEEKKIKNNQENMKPTVRIFRRPNKPKLIAKIKRRYYFKSI